MVGRRDVIVAGGGLLAGLGLCSLPTEDGKQAEDKGSSRVQPIESTKEFYDRTPEPTETTGDDKGEPGDTDGKKNKETDTHPTEPVEDTPTTPEHNDFDELQDRIWASENNLDRDLGVYNLNFSRPPTYIIRTHSGDVTYDAPTDTIDVRAITSPEGPYAALPPEHADEEYEEDIRMAFAYMIAATIDYFDDYLEDNQPDDAPVLDDIGYQLTGGDDGEATVDLVDDDLYAAAEAVETERREQALAQLYELVKDDIEY